MGRKPESPNLINARKHDCQPASANANPSRLILPHNTSNATRHTMRHYTTLHAHG